MHGKLKHHRLAGLRRAGTVWFRPVCSQQIAPWIAIHQTGIRDHAALHSNFTLLGKFDRVAGEIDQHLAQACNVASNEGWHRWIDFVQQLELFAARPAGHQIEGVFDHRSNLERRVLQLHFPGVNF